MIAFSQFDTQVDYAYLAGLKKSSTGVRSLADIISSMTITQSSRNQNDTRGRAGTHFYISSFSIQNLQCYATD